MGIIIRICGWCHFPIGIKIGKFFGISHGICKKCLKIAKGKLK